MTFKTDYKDEIPTGGTRLYNIVTEDGSIVQSNVKLVRANTNEQEGDAFGAKEVNDIHSNLNDKTTIEELLNGLISISLFTADPTDYFEQLEQYFNTAESEE